MCTHVLIFLGFLKGGCPGLKMYFVKTWILSSLSFLCETPRGPRLGASWSDLERHGAPWSVLAEYLFKMVFIG